jgi:hypothetical protein
VDYTLAAGTLNFAAGTNSAAITLSLINDSVAEGDETVVVTLSDPTGAVLDTYTSHAFTIFDDDLNTVSVSSADASASETGPDPGMFRFSRTGSTNDPVTALFEVLGTAGRGADYADFGTSITIPAGEFAVDVPVEVVNDATDELDETVQVKLATVPGGYKLGTSTATVTIVDDDDRTVLPVVSVVAEDPLAIEASAPDAARFTVSRGTNTAGDLTVDFTVGGSASSGSDYTAFGTNVVISNGLTSACIAVTPVNNSSAESDETVLLTLSSGDTYLLGTPSAATVTIADDDSAVVTVAATDASAGEWGADPGAFTVSRAVASAAPLTVNCLVEGTATGGEDYTSLSDSVTIPPGSNTTVLAVIPVGDEQAEGDETVLLTLVPGSYYTIGTPGSATVTLADRPIDAWRASRFTPAELADPGLGGDGADPDGDGVVNLLEYAFGLEPKTPDTTGFPAATQDAGCLAITYRRSKLAVDLNLAVEAGGNLFPSDWSSSGLVELPAADMGDYWRITVRDAMPITSAESRFLRLNGSRQ